MSSVRILYSRVSAVSVSPEFSFTSSIRPMVISNTLWAVVLGAGIVSPSFMRNGAGGWPSHPVTGVDQPALTLSATPEFSRPDL